MVSLKNLRSLPALRRFYGRSPAVVVCQDDPAEMEAIRGEVEALHSDMVVEREPGPLSAALGRPSVTVCDRYLDVSLHAERPSTGAVLAALQRAEFRCEECPQAADELRSPWAEVARSGLGESGS